MLADGAGRMLLSADARRRGRAHTGDVRRALAPAPLVFALTVITAAGCGGEQQPRPLAAFRVEPPYIPPRPPAASPPRAPNDGGHARRDPSGRATEQAADETHAPSDAQVAAELREGFGKGNRATAGEITNAASLTGRGLATVPPGAPGKLAAIIRAGNQVATRPYRYGGGHGGGDPEGLFVDSAYDCSGSISYALASARLITTPMDSGSFARWGKPGPGKYVSIYANGGHAFMLVAGLRFDTSGQREGGSRWQSATRSTAGFTVRHPPGL